VEGEPLGFFNVMNLAKELDAILSANGVEQQRRKKSVVNPKRQGEIKRNPIKGEKG